MKKSISFFLVIMATCLISSCVSGDNYTTGITQEGNSFTSNSDFLSASIKKQKEIKKPELLTADVGGGLQISFPKDLFKWDEEGNKEKGFSIKKNTRTWGWVSSRRKNVYIINLMKISIPSFWENKKEEHFLFYSHYEMIKIRYRKDKSGVPPAQYTKTVSIKGDIAGIPYIGFSSVVDYTRSQLSEKMTTILFRDKFGILYYMYLTKKYSSDPIDLLEIMERYVKVDPDYVVKN